jgi:hypothetical protein
LFTIEPGTMVGANGFIVVTSAYKIRIRTDSADSNAFMLLDDGELVAILVELADESHGDARGRWAIEAVFGLSPGRHPESFDSALDAAGWIGQHICHKTFELSDDVVELS